MPVKTIFEFAPRHTRIINLLAANLPTKLSAVEIAEILETSKAVAGRDLKDLTDHGFIKRLSTGTGHKFHYTLKKPTTVESATEIPELESPLLLEWLQKFAETDTYSIAPQRYYWVLPYCLANLYTLLSRQAVGEKLTPEDFKHAREALQELASRAQSYANTLHSLATNQELYDPASFAALLTGDAPVELVRKLAEKLVDNWGQARLDSEHSTNR